MRALLLLLLVAAAGPVGADPLAITVGDSIVETYSANDYPWIQGWGADLPKHFLPSLQWRNDAYGGASTRNEVSFGRWANTLAAHPQFILIQLGVSDSSYDADYYADPNTTYRANLHQMIVDARAIGAEPILVTPTAIRYVAADGVHVLRPSPLAPWASAMTAQAAADGVALIDMQNWSLDLYDSIGMPQAQSLYGFIIPYGDLAGVPDTLHFSPYGADQAAKMVLARIPAVSPNLAAYIAPTTVPALPPSAAALLVAALGLAVAVRSARAG